MANTCQDLDAKRSEPKIKHLLVKKSKIKIQPRKIYFKITRRRKLQILLMNLEVESSEGVVPTVWTKRSKLCNEFRIIPKGIMKSSQS